MTVCAALAGGVSVAYAAKVVVKDCSNDLPLRAKLAQLEAAGGGELRFKCGANPTIIVDGGPLTITKKVKILGGEDRVTLSGNNANTLIDVSATGKATLRGLTLTRGFNAGGDGGAIRNFGKLTVDSCVLSDNKAAASGGAILSYGPLDVRLSRFTSNRAANGGAIYSRFAAAPTTISRSTFDDNQTTSTTDGWGGAILIWDGASVSVDRSTFKSNVARSGGAVYVFGATSVLTSSRTTWQSNRAPAGNGGHVYNQGTFEVHGEDAFASGGALRGGAIYNAAGASLDVSTASFERLRAENDGGAIYNLGGGSVVNSTISENVTAELSGKGGGILNGGTLTLENVTVSGNSSIVGGGIANAVQSGAFLRLLHVTVTANSATSGGGLATDRGTAEATSTIIADNTSGGDCSNPVSSLGIVTSKGFNLSSDGNCTFNQPSDLPNTASQLNPLADNGGFTRTHMPSATSDAVDGAGGSTCLSIDQRVTRRPQGAACDIGAVERCGAGKPGVFGLSAPEDGGTLEVLGVLDWSDASCATKYLLSVRLGSSTGPVVATDVPVSGSSLSVPLYAREPTTYAWRVKACNKKKCRTSPWSTFVAAPVQF